VFTTFFYVSQQLKHKLTSVRKIDPHDRLTKTHTETVIFAKLAKDRAKRKVFKDLEI